MLISKAFAGFLALIHAAQAIFLWFPEYRCIADHTCISSKRELGAEATGVNENTLKIVQRLPEDGLPHDVQIRRLASRLKRKYQRTASPEVIRENENLAKRANTYKVVSAAPPTQANSAGIDQDGTDFSYFAQVLLGSGSKPLYMLLDSGAGQSWVMGPSCTSSPCKTHNSFGPADSSSYQPVNDAFSIAYGSGGVSGTFANDSLSIAGIKVPMTLGIANFTSNDFNAFPIDGILGLSRGAATYPNFVQALVASKALKANLFGMSLNRASDGPNTGEINFGAPDTSKYSGDLDYNPVSSNAEGDWAISMDTLGLRGKDAALTGRLAYLDTGTSYIFAPPDDAATFHSLIPGSNSSDGSTYTVPCTTSTPATFTFSGVTYTVSPEDWVGPMVNGACTSNIYGHAVVDGAWLLGDTFLKNVYIVFDIDGNRVGLAAKTVSSPSTTSATATSPTGGPISLQSSSALPSSSLLISGTTGSMSQTSSNAGPTESSSSGASTSQATAATPATSAASASSTTLGQPALSETSSPGLNGHQTSASSGTAAAESSIPPLASPTKISASIRLDATFSTIAFATFALITIYS